MKIRHLILAVTIGSVSLLTSCSTEKTAYKGANKDQLTAQQALPAERAQLNEQSFASNAGTEVAASNEVRTSDATEVLSPVKEERTSAITIQAPKRAKRVISERSEIAPEAMQLEVKEQGQKNVNGAKISSATKAAQGGDRSWIVALLLAIFLGGLGIHRFYLGYTWQGIVQLLTAGGCGIWALIDIIRIATRDLEPKDGSYTD